MQERHYKTILYFISAVILITLASQVYWNYKNYQAGKQQLINDVQVSLDNAVDRYYVDLAEHHTLGFAINNDNNYYEFNLSDTIVSHIDSIAGGVKGISSISIIQGGSKGVDSSAWDEFGVILQDPLEHFHSGDSITLDISTESSGSNFRYLHSNKDKGFESVAIYGRETAQTDTLLTKWAVSDSIRRDAIKWFMGDSSKRDNALARLTNRVIFSIASDSLDFDEMNRLVDDELSRKRISLDYGITFKDASGITQVSNPEIVNTTDLKTSSKSAYLPDRSSLQLAFSNETATILKNNLFGILLSFILMGAVVGSLLYLLRIIREQKQLAEIKNDFISNITHEFKTPIATIGVAMESIQHFNDTNDTGKTKKYVDMSSQQVNKLNIMVEKLLETATLDKDALALHKEESNIVDLLESLHQKYVNTHKDKSISFDSNSDQIWLPIDLFHMENALNNIVDNALKYGGNTIAISIKKMKSQVLISISDNGQELTKTQASQIFEKFYRVPKGNTHDIKGFGIGLYYTKTIIDKHGGQIVVATAPTTFKISLPYV